VTHSKLRTIGYIDGFNFYYGQLKDCTCKWLDLTKNVMFVGVKVDGDQLLLSLRQIPSIGFSARDLGLFEVSCVAEYLSLSPNSIQASMVNWALVINEKVTQQLVRVAAVAVDPYGLFDEYARLRRNDFEIEAK
jgi:hypothetical protein